VVFNSYTFALFFALLLGAYWAIPAWRGRKLLLLLGSYLFYAAWNPPFVVLLWISTVIDWNVGKRLEVTERLSARRALLLVSLCSNLGLLAYFKYGGFLVENLSGALSLLGVDVAFARPDIVLPVGISFYTFQTLSYTIDIYRRQAHAWDSRLDYALYVTFFPQLVAGPIVRATTFLPQCSEQRAFSGRHLSYGLWLLSLGLFQKVVLADYFLGPVADTVFNAERPPDVVSAWMGTLAFSGQIFCDFAGYSTCAIGAAMCFGFALPDNFRFPYAAIGFSEFWNRWHISLSSWLRDYLYIPLGGNRQGVGRTYVNLMLTMLLGGLWHGASWTFVIWGGLHGSYLAVERFLQRRLRGSAWVAAVPGPVWALLTFVLVLFTWVFFRAQSFARANEVISAMLGVAEGNALRHVTSGTIGWISLITVGILAVHWFMRSTTVEDVLGRFPSWLRGLVLAAMWMAMVLAPGDDRAFIYFQF
jgi:alginate O-acetyltransferase complex protein AlgI